MSNKSWLLAMEEQTFRCTSQDLCLAVCLECTAVLLCVLRCAVLRISWLRNGNSRHDSEFGGRWWAGGEAAWPGER